MIKLLFLLPLLFEALSDGLTLRGYELHEKNAKLIGKQFKTLLVVSWFAVLYFACKFQFWEAVSVYVLLRIIIFNYVHNLAGWPAIKKALEFKLKRQPKWYETLYYVGTVSVIDRIVALLGVWWMILIAQGIAGVFLYFILIGKI
jgi:hypothetical protein